MAASRSPNLFYGGIVNMDFFFRVHSLIPRGAFRLVGIEYFYSSNPAIFSWSESSSLNRVPVFTDSA